MNSASAFSVVSVLIVLGVVFSVARRGLVRPFSILRARTSMRSPFGGNVASVIAIAEIVQLGVVLGILSEPSQEWAPAIAVALVAALAIAAIGLAITPAHSRDLIGMFALGVALVETYLSHGFEAVILLVVLLLPALWLLGLARGFLGR